MCAGCDKAFDEPAEWSPATLTPNMTIAELKAIYKGAKIDVNNPGAIVGGKVISTDKYGNFYRSFFLQDETGGIEIKVGKTTLYNTYKIGQTVYVKPHGLRLGAYGQMVSLGMETADTKYENAWIDVPLLISRAIFTGVEGAPVAPDTVRSTTGFEAHLGKWVILPEAVYKSGTPATWAKAADPNITAAEAAYGEHTFPLSGGGNVVVRTSGYSKFAGTTVPFAAGQRVNIKGVLTRYGNTIQLVLNTDKDVAVVSD